MQINLFDEYTNFSGKSVLIGLSGGINSAAVLCVLAQYPERYKPEALHLFYADFKEHSPDTRSFVARCVWYARKHFKNVKLKVTKNSVNERFREKKYIPHPTISDCSLYLKIKPMEQYFEDQKIDFDLIGYVREETKRIARQIEKRAKNKIYLIASLSNEECFEIVKKQIGWYPKIYDIRHDGKRIFLHNNCLPCKNMTLQQMQHVQYFFPRYYEEAMKTAEIIGSSWGRLTANACKYCETFG